MAVAWVAFPGAAARVQEGGAPVAEEWTDWTVPREVKGGMAVALAALEGKAGLGEAGG